MISPTENSFDRVLCREWLLIHNLPFENRKDCPAAVEGRPPQGNFCSPIERLHKQRIGYAALD
jgi:hypothetical protein